MFIRVFTMRLLIASIAKMIPSTTVQTVAVSSHHNGPLSYRSASQGHTIPCSNSTERSAHNSQLCKAVRATASACRKFSICMLQSMDRKFSICGYSRWIIASKYVVCVICLICQCFLTTLEVPYVLESNPHPNLIRTSFCRFLKRKKKKFAVLIRTFP